MMRVVSIVVLLVILIGGVAAYATPPTTVRVYDILSSVSGDILAGAKVRCELVTPDTTKIAYDSVSGYSLGKSPYPFDTSTSSTGYTALRLIPNKFIIPHGSRYVVTVSYDGRTVYSVKLNITQSDSVRVRDCQQ